MQKHRENKWDIGGLCSGGNPDAEHLADLERMRQAAETLGENAEGLDDLNRMQQATKQLGAIQLPTKPKKRFGLF